MGDDVIISNLEKIGHSHHVAYVFIATLMDERLPRSFGGGYGRE
jgi:hypothetical protein